MKLQEREIKTTKDLATTRKYSYKRLLQALSLLSVLALMLTACQKIDPDGSTPTDNPFKETGTLEVNPSSSGDLNKAPTTTGPGGEGTTVPPDISDRTGEPLPDWMLIPWSDPEMKARELEGSALAGSVLAQEQKSKRLPYTGGEMLLDYELSGTGLGRSQGFLIFLDGLPQPYTIEREKPQPGDSEYRYLHAVDIEDDSSKAEFTLRFFPVTGQKGDLLDLSIGMVLHAGFVPKNPMQFFFSPYYSLRGMTGYVLDFQATPPPLEPAEPTPNGSAENILSRVKWSKEDMTSEELAYAASHTSSDDGMQTKWQLFLNGEDTRSLAHLNLDQYDRLDFTFKLLGIPGSRWQIVLYLDHQPLVLDSSDHFTLDVVRGQKSVLNFSLDPELLDGVHTFYLIAMPWTEVNALGERESFDKEIQTRPWSLYRASEWRAWKPEP